MIVSAEATQHSVLTLCSFKNSTAFNGERNMLCCIR